jgi:hypothetical protein
MAREAGRNLDHRLVDGDRDGVQVGSVTFHAQPLRFQWNCSATGKWIVKCGELSWVKERGGVWMIAIEFAGLTPGFPNLRTRSGPDYSLFVFSQMTRSSMILKSRSRSLAASTLLTPRLRCRS